MGLFSRKAEGKTSYAQCGEDLIVVFLLQEVLRITRPTYLDLGANHPVNLSNTYAFYMQGSRGVLVEPDPDLCEKIRKRRPDDVVVEAGVGATSGEADFFVMSARTLNTFSRAEAERYQGYGTHQIVREMKLPVLTVNDIVAQHQRTVFGGRAPHFVSLDVEGLDEVILRSFDFSRWRPEVFCIETLTYTEDKSERKLDGIIALMHERGYMTWADTYINTVFVDREAHRRRQA